MGQFSIIESENKLRTGLSVNKSECNSESDKTVDREEIGALLSETKTEVTSKSLSTNINNLSDPAVIDAKIKNLELKKDVRTKKLNEAMDLYQNHSKMEDYKKYIVDRTASNFIKVTMVPTLIGEAVGGAQIYVHDEIKYGLAIIGVSLVPLILGALTGYLVGKAKVNKPEEKLQEGYNEYKANLINDVAKLEQEISDIDKEIAELTEVKNAVLHK